MNRPVRRRGRKPTAPQSKETTPEDGQSNGQDTDSGFTSLPAVRQLIQIYRDTMYQCYFPFLPEKDLLTRWENAIPDPDGPSYLLLMALCAVSSQTVALNAVFDEGLLQGLCTNHGDKYLTEAVSRIPQRISQSQDLDYLRSFGLLALHALRRGDHSDLHRYLGLYHALVAQNGFHDEGRWPEHLSSADVDDRRRFFWCVYRLEIHSACVLGHVVRMPEAQVSVLYPRITPAMDPEAQAWTAGWDYITDLFRLLEYAIFSLRGSSSGSSRGRNASLAVLCDRPSPTTLLGSLARLKAGKPHILLGSGGEEPGSNNNSGGGGGCCFQSNRCKYMGVQITSTEALVDIMALLYCQAPAREVMGTAESFLEEVAKAPLIMFRVASSQIVHQLLGVGHMLYNASQYENGHRHRSEARRLIALLGDLVRSLEHDIPSAAEAGQRLLGLADAAAVG